MAASRASLFPTAAETPAPEPQFEKIMGKQRTASGTTSNAPIDRMIEALGLEAEAIKRNNRSSTLELRGGMRQGKVGKDFLYVFPLAEEPNIRDDSPVKIVVSGREIDGSVVSVRNGLLTVAVAEDIGQQIPFARLVVNDSFLVERLREKLIGVKNGEVLFNCASADAVLHNNMVRIAEADVPDNVFSAGAPLNNEQRIAVRRSAGSGLLYVWGPPGTGKTTTLAAIVHALFLQGKSILIVSNTNIAVDTVLERIGDRLCTFPEFHQAAILRFGPIVSDTLRTKYENQVNLERAVEQHSASLLGQRESLRREADSIQAAMNKLKCTLDIYSQLHTVKAEREQIKGELLRLRSDEQRQRREKSSEESKKQQTQADLDRVRSMGAIRRFFSGLNEEELNQSLAQSRIRLQSLDKSLAEISKKQRACEGLYSGKQKEIEGFERKLVNQPSEPACRANLDCETGRLNTNAEQIRRIDGQLATIRGQLLSNCRVLATTVYQTYLKSELARQYDVVIVDEASMLPLPLGYYAAGLATDRVIVAGDFRQLAPIITSDNSLCEEWLKRDIFRAACIADAVSRRQTPAALVTLREQYRMQGDICDLINSFFYENLLASSSSTRSQSAKVRPFANLTSGLVYVDTSAWGPWAAFKLGTYSRYNVLHALLVRKLVARLNEGNYLRSSEEVNDRLGVVSPYAAQCRLLADLIGEELGVRGSVYAATVHRFQGNERDTMIVDLTDSTGCRAGKFIKARNIDEDGARLLNVALSRARICTVVVANFQYLHSKLARDSYVRRLLEYLVSHGEPLDVADCFPFAPSAILAGHQAATGALLTEVDGQVFAAFTAGTFYSAFEADCRNAKREIVVFSPFMTERGTSRWVDLWRAKIAQGVRIRIVTRPPGDHGGTLEHGLQELIDGLRACRITVDLRSRMHEKVAFIDGCCLWHGSLNILSHHDTSESMLRVESECACERVGRLVAGTKLDEHARLDLACEENPHCPECGKPMVWNTGRYGVWFECSCGHRSNASRGARASRGDAQPRERAAPSQGFPEPLGDCPQCGKVLVEKSGRYGPFISCSDFPRCKYKRNFERRKR